MKTEQAYQIYQSNAAAQNEFMSTILWLLFILFVIAPLIVFFTLLIIRLLTRKKELSK